jgi:peptidoglycan/xylan/chitin deacetylase (PgdA/CDA1 family)
MRSRQLLTRVQGRYRRTSARLFFRRPLAINAKFPFVSFTFDDFPRSALLTGGAILKHFGAAGTYYASFGLLGKQSDTGTMFLREDLDTLLQQGHELGCHTLEHCHAGDTKPILFEDSVIKNQLALNELLPGVAFKTLSYPKSQPRAWTKRRVERHFACCRGGGQTFNAGTADLNCLSAFFLEQSRNNPDAIKNLIDQNQLARGWLIFATHDICDNPTPWGCTPEFFEDIVRHAISSGARILPVVEALEALRESSLS